MLHLTINQKPGGDDFAKARELIEIRGTSELSLHDRRIINILYANAGPKLCDDVQHTIGIVELRGSHKGSERVTDSITRLQKTLVLVPTVDKKGKPATRRVSILSDTTVTNDENDPDGHVIYSFSPGMRAIIRDSTLWGRVRSAVVFAFTSKYSLTLYELITARINLKHVWQEDFLLEDLRALLGVPSDKLLRTPDLLRKVIQPAQTEVNGLADFGVKIEPIRTGGTMRGAVTGFRMSWWRKDVPALQEAYEELKRSKVGRLPRLTGKVDEVKAAGGIPGLSREAAGALNDLRGKPYAEVPAKVAKLAKMRADERTNAAK